MKFSLNYYWFLLLDRLCDACSIWQRVLIKGQPCKPHH